MYEKYETKSGTKTSAITVQKKNTQIMKTSKLSLTFTTLLLVLFDNFSFFVKSNTSKDQTDLSLSIIGNSTAMNCVLHDRCSVQSAQADKGKQNSLFLNHLVSELQHTFIHWGIRQQVLDNLP